MNNKTILTARYDKELSEMDGVEIINHSTYTVDYEIDTTKVVVDEKEEFQENSCEYDCGNDCHRCANNDGVYISTIKISGIKSKKEPIVFTATCLDQIGNVYNDYW